MLTWDISDEKTYVEDFFEDFVSRFLDVFCLVLVFTSESVNSSENAWLIEVICSLCSSDAFDKPVFLSDCKPISKSEIEWSIQDH